MKGAHGAPAVGSWFGKTCMQVVVDANCSVGFGKLDLSTVPMTAVDVPHDRVLPFQEEPRPSARNS